MTDEIVKVCRICGDDVTAENAVRHRGRPGGFDRVHRDCYNAQARERYASDPAFAAAQLESTRKWREANPDYKREWSAANAARTTAEVEAAQRRLHPDGTKRCRGGHTAPLSEFSRDASKADGLKQYCRDCDHADLLRSAAASFEERGLYGCAYCPGDYEAVDHVVPKALGGTDEPHNLVPCCQSCNSRKHAKPLHVWLSEALPDAAALVFPAYAAAGIT